MNTSYNQVNMGKYESHRDKVLFMMHKNALDNN